MSLALAIALLALLVALFALVALVAVYARVKALEAGRTADLSGYASLVGRPAPRAVRPGAGQRAGVVAVLDADCALCHAVWAALATAPDVRAVAVLDRPAELGDGPAELLVDLDTRVALFEGYAPTLLGLDAAGVVTERVFVYADTDLAATISRLTGAEVTT
ncbi:hypothetical protein WEH80_32000 [Actinomycetes bacterium KLBMP 9759]